MTAPPIALPGIRSAAARPRKRLSPTCVPFLRTTHNDPNPTTYPSRPAGQGIYLDTADRHQRELLPQRVRSRRCRVTRKDHLLGGILPRGQAGQRGDEVGGFYHL